MVQRTSPKLDKLCILLFGGNHWIAGVQYVRNVLRALLTLPEEERISIILKIGHKNINCGYEDEFGNFPNIVIDAKVKEKKTFSQELLAKIKCIFPRDEFSDGKLLSDSCTVIFPIKDPDLPGSYEKVFWIPDFQYKRYPEFFPEKARSDRDILFGKTFQTGGIVVLSSEAVKADFHKYFPEHSDAKIRVLNFHSLFTEEDYAVDPSIVCRKYELPERFAYLPNQFFAHKRHDTVFNALAELRKEGLEIPLVCTGNTSDFRTEDYFTSLQKIIRENGMEGQIRILGLIPRNDQVQIFRKSALVLQPSLFEGWSTTVEDARALGKRLILSDIDVHQEQAPENGTFFRAADVSDLKIRLKQLWPQCQSGPDFDAEKAAYQRSLQYGLKFARNFLNIMQEAHEIYHKKKTGEA